jgi:hypothetical protein
MASVLPSSETSVFWSRHKSLSTSIEKRTQLLARNLASPNALVDPMVAFTHVLARATVVYLGEVAEVVGSGLAGTATGAGVGGATVGGGEWSAYGAGKRNTVGANVGQDEASAVSSTHKLAAAAYTQRAFQAAREVVRLVQGIRPVSCFKVRLSLPRSHFLDQPRPLCKCDTNKNRPTFSSQIQSPAQPPSSSRTAALQSGNGDGRLMGQSARRKH